MPTERKQCIKLKKELLSAPSPSGFDLDTREPPQLLIGRALNKRSMDLAHYDKIIKDDPISFLDRRGFLMTELNTILRALKDQAQVAQDKLPPTEEALAKSQNDVQALEFKVTNLEATNSSLRTDLTSAQIAQEQLKHARNALANANTRIETMLTLAKEAEEREKKAYKDLEDQRATIRADAVGGL